MNTDYLLTLLVFIIGGLLFLVVGWSVGKLFRPHQPNEEKNTIYESGEDSVGNNQAKFNSRFLFIGLVFLLFDIELALLFPWAVVADYAQGSHIEWFWLIEMAIFVGFLSFGLVFIWKKGLLQWNYKPTPPPIIPSKVPDELYQQVGKQQNPPRTLS
jgi:NADH-quinone oxidoreductase subunit A